MPQFTILGGSGYIGRNLVAYLLKQGHRCQIPLRGEIPDYPCSHLIYAIGITADFRTKPFETVDAHVCHLMKVLNTCNFDSFLYLSSTRVYERIAPDQVADETSKLIVDVNALFDLYNLSKLMGESVCFSVKNPLVRVVRLSNVYGADMNPETFLGALMASARNERRVKVYQSPDSGKDYVHINDVVRILPEICIRGQHRLYNLASGIVTRHTDVAQAFFSSKRVLLEFEKDGPTSLYPRILVNRLINEFNGKMTDFHEGFCSLLKDNV